jgi:hypothetical protein
VPIEDPKLDAGADDLGRMARNWRRFCAWMPGLVAAVNAGGAGGLADAPSDGLIYGRQNGEWVEIVPGVGGGVTAPSGLTATAVSASQIVLVWTDNSDDEAGFLIERSLNGSTGWTVIHETAADATGYNDIGLDGATAYYYRVRAFTLEANSAATAVASDTTPSDVGQSSFATPPTTATRTDGPYVLGFFFTVSSAITVSKLGRLYVTGNSHDHLVRIWRVSDSALMATGTVLASGDSDADGFKWIDITPANLATATEYVIGVSEASAEDAWTDSRTPTGLQSVFNNIYRAGDGGSGMPPSHSTDNYIFGSPAMWYT